MDIRFTCRGIPSQTPKSEVWISQTTISPPSGDGDNSEAFFVRSAANLPGYRRLAWLFSSGVIVKSCLFRILTEISSSPGLYFFGKHPQLLRHRHELNAEHSHFRIGQVPKQRSIRPTIVHWFTIEVFSAEFGNGTVRRYDHEGHPSQRQVSSNRPSKADKVIDAGAIDELRAGHKKRTLDETTPENKRIPPILCFTPKAQAAKTLVIPKKLQVVCWHKTLWMRRIHHSSDLCLVTLGSEQGNGGKGAIAKPPIAEGFDYRQSMKRRATCSCGLRGASMPSLAGAVLKVLKAGATYDPDPLQRTAPEFCTLENMSRMRPTAAVSVSSMYPNLGNPSGTTRYDRILSALTQCSRGFRKASSKEIGDQFKIGGTDLSATDFGGEDLAFGKTRNFVRAASARRRRSPYRQQTLNWSKVTATDCVGWPTTSLVTPLSEAQPRRASHGMPPTAEERDRPRRDAGTKTRVRRCPGEYVRRGNGGKRQATARPNPEPPTSRGTLSRARRPRNSTSSVLSSSGPSAAPGQGMFPEAVHPIPRVLGQTEAARRAS